MLLQDLSIISQPSVNPNSSYGPETPNFSQNQGLLVHFDLENWQMTLKNNRAPLLCYFKPCASFHCRMWNQTGVTAQKWLNWVLISVTVTFDLWCWPFALTSLLSMLITPENLIIIGWEKHSAKGMTDTWMDRQTEVFLELLGSS